MNHVDGAVRVHVKLLALQKHGVRPAARRVEPGEAQRRTGLARDLLLGGEQLRRALRILHRRVLRDRAHRLLGVDARAAREDEAASAVPELRRAPHVADVVFVPARRRAEHHVAVGAHVPERLRLELLLRHGRAARGLELRAALIRERARDSVDARGLAVALAPLLRHAAPEHAGAAHDDEVLTGDGRRRERIGGAAAGAAANDRRRERRHRRGNHCPATGHDTVGGLLLRCAGVRP
mmetsp:Transcript_16273/g.49734  ORF Transcript_16273/g.49734 Transcript_16273/m.49734 type:complete len:237 (+) Transcript_16273:2027-2737(+)